MKHVVARATKMLAVAAAGTALLANARRKARRIDLRGRVVLITGGGHGLGLAISKEFARRGANLAICGRDGEVLTQAQEELREFGVDVLAVPTDAAEPQQVDALVQRVLEHFGQIDVLVNNAGECFVGPAAQLQAHDMEHALRNLFWVVFHPTMAVLPHMRGRQFGRIVNICSIGGRVATPHMTAYNAAKHAVAGFGSTLAIELRRDGIRVSTMTPPPLDNGAALHVHFNGDTDAEFSWFARAQTSRLQATSTERVARAIADAAEHGDTERAVTPLSWIAQRLAGISPNAMSFLLAQVNRFYLPAAPGSLEHTSPMYEARDIVSSSANPKVLKLAEAANKDEMRVLPKSVAPLKENAPAAEPSAPRRPFVTEADRVLD